MTTFVEPNTLPATELTCPSARCKEGAIFLGVFGQDGRLGYLTPRMTVDADFVEQVQLARAPEARFRFAQPCIEHECAHWAGSDCGLINQVINASSVRMTASQRGGVLPHCAIRTSCRWYAQTGCTACAVCPSVVYDPTR